jgi:hypothetical protein
MGQRPGLRLHRDFPPALKGRDTAGRARAWPHPPSGFTQRVRPVGARRRLAPTSSLPSRTLSTNQGGMPRERRSALPVTQSPWRPAASLFAHVQRTSATRPHINQVDYFRVARDPGLNVRGETQITCTGWRLYSQVVAGRHGNFLEGDLRGVWG